jgi:hypothetical protein
MSRTRVIAASSVAAAVVLLAGACQQQDSVTGPVAEPQALHGGHGRPELRNTSVTPALVKALVPGVKITTVISSDDTLPETPAYIFGGSADGAGLLRDRRGNGFTYLVNHEDNFAVSRVHLDEDFRPVSGEYVINSTGGQWRLCSATMVTPAEHGFGPLFITAGESGQESMIHALDPYTGALNASRLLPAFGRWSTENAITLPRCGIGDLENGNLFVMARTSGETRETAMRTGRKYKVEFRRIKNQETLTGAQIGAESTRLQAIRFGRVEDLDYGKSLFDDGRTIYFNVTGQAYSGANADSSRTRAGRVYKLTLDWRDPTRGELELLLDGDDPRGPAAKFQNVDNILATPNYLYIAEDPNGYGTETHDAYLWQYSLRTRQLRPVLELDHRRDKPDADYYGSRSSAFGSWEYGSMLDATDELSRFGFSLSREGTFVLAVQPHTWRGPKYQGVDGGTVRPNEDQASQIVVVRGLPR